MPILTNNRRELFAQLLFQGFTAVDAYEQAGFKRHDGNASTLSRHPEIVGRLEELRGGLDRVEDGADAGFPVGTRVIAARAKVTAESLLDEADKVLAGAMSSHQYGAANGAIKNKGVLSGVWIERSEIGSPGEFDHLSDRELEAAVRERLIALGWMPVPAISNNGSILNGEVTDPEDRD